MYAVVFHAHQKIDKIAFRKLRRLGKNMDGFPTLKQVLYFEGPNGPDASKLKNDPKVEQPWHFVDPLNSDDQTLYGIIGDHYERLVAELKAGDKVRAAFEAAWIAHAVVDGLTPAHHYPYQSELGALHGSDDIESRTSVVKRLTVKGDSYHKTVLQTVRLIGPKGLLMSHTAFEGGAYVLLKALRQKRKAPNSHRQADVMKLGVVKFFEQQVQEVHKYKMYESFCTFGWTPRLAMQVRRQLLPRMIDIVALTWYAALVEATE